MKNRETEPLLCPFCGAPQRRYIPTDTVQVKCQYCGGIFLVPPRIGGEIPQCPNHSDRLTIGMCNDCGKSFCSDCLHIYPLETESANATLYLCPTCLRGRHIKKANGFIFVGLVWLLIGMFFAMVIILFSILLIIMGVGAIIYGVSRRSEALGELTVEELQKDERRSAELGGVEGMNVEEVYNRLVTQYVNHWGVQTGMELLENEIMAYTRHGESFSEAVKKVYLRQKKK